MNNAGLACIKYDKWIKICMLAIQNMFLFLILDNIDNIVLTHKKVTVLMKIPMEVHEHLKITHKGVIKRYTTLRDSFDFDNGLFFLIRNLLIFVCNLWILESQSFSLH